MIVHFVTVSHYRVSLLLDDSDIWSLIFRGLHRAFRSLGYTEVQIDTLAYDVESDVLN